jgi:hypothetical protein
VFESSRSTCSSLMFRHQLLRGGQAPSDSANESGGGVQHAATPSISDASYPGIQIFFAVMVSMCGGRLSGLAVLV